MERIVCARVIGSSKRCFGRPVVACTITTSVSRVTTKRQGHGEVVSVSFRPSVRACLLVLPGACRSLVFSVVVSEFSVVVSSSLSSSSFLSSPSSLLSPPSSSLSPPSTPGEEDGLPEAARRRGDGDRCGLAHYGSRRWVVLVPPGGETQRKA